VPSLLFAYIVIVTIGPYRGIPVFIIGLSLTGWAPWTQLIYDAIGRLRNEQYMEAAIAVGSTTNSQLRYYLIPNLLPILIPAIAQELAASLLILAELGFLGIFVGTKHGITLGDLLAGEQPELSYPEWAGMLAGTRLEIFIHWWLPIVPAGAFAIAIFGLNLLADGLREALDIRARR
jgi:peptide/nickel transport system permease protein